MRFYHHIAAFCAALTAAAACTAVIPAAAETENNLPLNRGMTDTVYSDNQATAAASCNSVYYDGWTGQTGSYLAYDLSEIPASEREAINVAWYSGSWGNYDYTVTNEAPYAAPSAYSIYVNAAPGGAYPEDGWEQVCAKEGISTHSGQFLIDSSVSPYNWVMFTIDGIQGTNSQVTLNLDLHSVPDGENDSWIFYGDSITACGMTTFSTGDGNFADLVYAIDPSHYPAQENGGIGGIRSIEGKKMIDSWLQAFPGKYVSIAYGTNDCWGNQTGAEGYYENTVYMIEAVLNAGKVAILPKIPYSLEPGVSTYVADYNAQIDRIYSEYPSVIPGPDFYSFFAENPDLLSADGVHPNEAGYNEMRKLWAKTACETIYTAAPEIDDSLRGDVNCDGKVNVADAVLLAEYLTAQKNQLPALRTADLDENGTLDARDLTKLKRMMLQMVYILPYEPPVMTE